MPKLISKLREVYETANRRTGGWLAVISRSIHQFGEARAPEAAAGLAYYAFFSLFPLMLALIAVGSFILEQDQVFDQVTQLVNQVFPTSQLLIETNLERVLELRGAVGVIGIIGLTWSGTAVFTNLVHNINNAWPAAKPRGFLGKRLIAFGVVGILIGLLALAAFGTIALNLISRMDLLSFGGINLVDMRNWTFFSRILEWMVKTLLFLGLYTWVPNIRVDRAAAAVGAVVAATAWELATSGFTWYLTSGIVQYELIYGSLGTIVAMLFWIYLSSLIILYGAHLSAAVSHRSSKP